MAQTLCDTCTSVVAKYRCPACACLSCSLACINAHKATAGCDGKARSKFVSLATFDDNQLIHDYSYLEEVGRYVDASKRDPKTQSGPMLRGPKKVVVASQQHRLLDKLQWLRRQEQAARVPVAAVAPPASDTAAEADPSPVSATMTASVSGEDPVVDVMGVETPGAGPVSVIPAPLLAAALPATQQAQVEELLLQQLTDQALLSASLKTLQRECRRRGTVLRLMPAGMQRRKDNTSQYSARCVAQIMKGVMGSAKLIRVCNRL
jgi:hypothetical protein